MDRLSTMLLYVFSLFANSSVLVGHVLKLNRCLGHFFNDRLSSLLQQTNHTKVVLNVSFTSSEILVIIDQASDSTIYYLDQTSV